MSGLGEASQPNPADRSAGLVPVGLISLLQIQKEKLIGDTPNGQVYRTTSLVKVGELRVGRAGVITEIDGGWVLDRHHTAHPAGTRAHRPDRILSIGFSGHYKLIENEFGWAPPGVAGENIIVDTAERLRHQDVAGGFVIRTTGGDVEPDPPRVLDACVPFSRFMLRDPGAPPARVLPTLEFLGAGMRGFSMGASRVPNYATVRTGDLVLRKVAA